MYETVESINYRGFNIDIYFDEFAESPRTAWDNLGTMLCSHRRYNLGDNHFYSGYDLWKHIAKAHDLFDAEGFYETDENKIRKWFFKNCISLPLNLYDHGGLAMSTVSFVGRAQHAQWDSGCVGLIYITKKRAKEEYGWKRLSNKRIKRIEQYLRNEVEMYDTYLHNDVYSYTVNETGDSCGMFYGDDWGENGLLDDAGWKIDAHIIKERHKHFELVKTWITNHVPLTYRKPLRIGT